jgi:hypothetical protein
MMMTHSAVAYDSTLFHILELYMSTLTVQKTTSMHSLHYNKG